MPTVKELHKECRKMGITGYSKLKKSTLLRKCKSKSRSR